MAESNQAARLNSTKFVHVICKLPHGLEAEILEEPDAEARKAAESGTFGSRLQLPPAVRARFTFKGANSLRNDFTTRGLAQPNFGYGITVVPLDFWEEWLARHKDMTAVKRGFIYALPTERAAKSEAKERESELTGVEPLRPDVERDPRMPRGTTPETMVEADRAHLARLQQANGR